MNTNNIELLQTAKEYSEKLMGAVIRTAEAFQSYKDGNGSEIMISIVDGLQWLMDVVGSSEELKAKIDILNINDKLKGIIEAYENQDYILIGDLLQYELLPAIEDINNKISNMIKN